MTNASVADLFELLSKLMEIHGENSFKVKTYSTAAYRIEKLPQQLQTMLPEQVSNISGIGEATSKKILEIISTGTLALLEEYILKTPPGIIDMLSVKGIGPKKIALFWKELGLESIGELEYACNENRLISLKGFGAKTQESILASIAFIHNSQGFYLWSEAEKIALQVAGGLLQQFPGNRFEPTGAYLQQATTLQHIDFVTDVSQEQLQSYFSDWPTILSIAKNESTLDISAEEMPTLRFYCCDTAQVAATLLRTSSSAVFYDAFCERYPLPATASSQQDFFEAHQLPYIIPALREDLSYLEKAANGSLPKLISSGDIRGVIHSHSTWSDGIHSIRQMAEASRDKGYEYLVISDHSQTASYASGLKPERVLAQHQEIEQLNNELAPFKIFKSIESDILSDGSLDYAPELLNTFDLVIASVHSNLKMTEEKAMQRLIAAICNPYTSILGHPTGRLLLSRAGYPVDYKLMIEACIEHQVVIEINAHPRRLDLDWTWIAYALDKGATLSINPDAHSVDGINVIKYGILAAQKGGLTAGSNLSSRTLVEMEAFVQEQKAKRTS